MAEALDALKGRGLRLLKKVGIGSQAAGDGTAGLVIQVVTLFGTFVSFTLLGRRLGPAEYGVFSAMYSMIGISIALAYIGPQLAFLQHAIDSSVKTMAGHFFTLQAVTLTFSFVVFLTAAKFIVPTISLITMACFMVAELVGVAIIQLAATLRLIVTGYRSTVALNLLPVVLKLVAILGLFVIGELNLRWYGVFFMGLCVVSAAVVFFRITRVLAIPRKPTSMKLPHLRTTMTISLTIWAFNVHNAGDQLTMSAHRFGAILGLYAAAYRLVQFSSIPINALVDSSYRSFLDPEIGRQKQRALKYTAFTTVYTTVAAIGIIVLAPFVLPLLVGKGFNGAITIARWLAPLMVLRGMSNFPQSALMGFGRSVARLTSIIISGSIAIVLYVTLVPRHSWRGAVFASYCSDFVLVAVTWSMVWYYDSRRRVLNE